jgi:hypothetical protein
VTDQRSDGRVADLNPREARRRVVKCPSLEGLRLIPGGGSPDSRVILLAATSQGAGPSVLVQRSSPLTVAGPCRIRTGFPVHPERSSIWEARRSDAALPPQDYGRG